MCVYAKNIENLGSEEVFLHLQESNRSFLIEKLQCDGQPSWLLISLIQWLFHYGISADLSCKTEYVFSLTTVMCIMHFVFWSMTFWMTYQFIVFIPIWLSLMYFSVYTCKIMYVFNIETKPTALIQRNLDIYLFWGI